MKCSHFNLPHKFMIYDNYNIALWTRLSRISDIEYSFTHTIPYHTIPYENAVLTHCPSRTSKVYRPGILPKQRKAWERENKRTFWSPSHKPSTRLHLKCLSKGLTTDSHRKTFPRSWTTDPWFQEGNLMSLL